MNRKEIRHFVIEAICDVAPELSPEEIDAEVNFREEYDIDSMDFLNIIIAIKHSTGVNIPERDYAKIDSLNNAVVYLSEKHG